MAFFECSILKCSTLAQLGGEAKREDEKEIHHDGEKGTREEKIMIGIVWVGCAPR